MDQQNTPLGQPNIQFNPQVQTKKAISWPVLVIVIFIGNVILWADRTNFSVATAAWSKQFHWTPAIIGMMLSAFSFGYMLLQPLGGYLSDRLGPKKMIAYSCGGWSLFTLLTPLAPAVIWLTGSFRALLGIFEAPFNPAITTAVSQYIPEQSKRGTYMAFLQSGSKLGPAIGTSVGALILRAWGTSAIFMFFGLLGIAISLIWFLYSYKRSEEVNRRIIQSTEVSERAKEAEYSVRQLLSSSTIWGILLAYFSVPYCTFLFLTWLPIYLNTYRHFKIVTAGLLSALPYLAAFVAYIFAGYLSDKMAEKGWTKNGLNRKLPIYFGTLVYLITLPIAAVTTSNNLAVLMIILANVGLAFVTNQYWVMVSDITKRYGGTISGFMNFFGILGATIAPSLTGFIVAATGNFTLPFIISVCILVAAALVVALFVRVKPLSELIKQA